MVSSYYLGKPVTKGHLSCNDTLAWIQRCPLVTGFTVFSSNSYMCFVGILLLHINICLLVKILNRWVASVGMVEDLELPSFSTLVQKYVTLFSPHWSIGPNTIF